jgi:hypothetical protein
VPPRASIFTPRRAEASGVEKGYSFKGVIRRFWTNGQTSQGTPPTASEQLEALLGYPWPFPGRPPKHDLSTWTVTDDWPEHIPVTEAEVDVFEAWFGDLFDELFGPYR